MHPTFYRYIPLLMLKSITQTCGITTTISIYTSIILCVVDKSNLIFDCDEVDISWPIDLQAKHLIIEWCILDSVHLNYGTTGLGILILCIHLWISSCMMDAGGRFPSGMWPLQF